MCEQRLLTINKFSRPGTKIKKVTGVVVHYVQNSNTTALQNRNFFENRKDGRMGYGSAHYIIDLDGKIIQCIPESEVAYHCSLRNNDTIGVECTHIDDMGNMTGLTYNSLLEVVSNLMKKYELNIDKLYLHFNITGKKCHKWFVDNPAEWKKFKNIVKELIEV